MPVSVRSSRLNHLYPNAMNKRVLISSLAFFIIIGFAFVINNPESKELKDVLKSPMANLQITKGDEIRRTYSDRGTTLGKPDYVDVHIEYQPKATSTKVEVFNELVENMRQVVNNSDEITFDGMDGGERFNNEGDLYRAVFSYKTYLRIDVAIYEPQDDSEVNTVLVNIENYGTYPGVDFLMTLKDFFTI